MLWRFTKYIAIDYLGIMLKCIIEVLVFTGVLCVHSFLFVVKTKLSVCSLATLHVILCSRRHSRHY